VSSEYEQTIGALIAEKRQMLELLKNKSDVSKMEIGSIQQQIECLENLYDNYHLGMNYFRRAQGGRKGLRE
jgi:hypothetical protein